MGGGIGVDGSPAAHVVPRCDQAIRLACRLSRPLVVTSSSYSLNVPPKIDGLGFPLSEASACYDYIRGHGYEGDMLCEQLSHDSVGSVFFTLALFAEKFRVRDVVFVTSHFHAERVKSISRFVNSVAFGGAFAISTNGVVDVGITEERVGHEVMSLKLFNDMFSGVKSRGDFVFTFFSEHSNYNRRYGSSKVLSSGYLY